MLLRRRIACGRTYAFTFDDLALALVSAEDEKMISTTLRRYSHKAGLNFWHLEWCTKYRYNMMRKFEHKNLVEAVIRKAAHEHNIKVHLISVMPDHVHLLVTLPRGTDEREALFLLKGKSAYIIFKNHERFRLRYPQGHFWRAERCAITVATMIYLQ